MNLHPHEVRVLKVLKGRQVAEEVANLSGLELGAVMRAAGWLSTKKLVKVEEEVEETITLGEEGKKYAKEGLPERRVITMVKEGQSLENIRKALGNFFPIALGWLRKKGMGKVSEGKIEIFVDIETDDEKLLKWLAEKEEPQSVENLSEEHKHGLELLRSRGDVLKILKRKKYYLVPNKKAVELVSKLEGVEEEKSQLTPEMLRDGSWSNISFREYDVSVYVSPTPSPRIHPVSKAIQQIREIFVAMGFREISGPIVEVAFWNFDALFQPQDHPARDLHDTFYLKHPKEMEIPKFEILKEKVKAVHEDGGDTGSLGWGYRWDEKLARLTLLRTHTTAVSARALAELKEKDLPAKIFCIGKVFRNEAVDYKHLPEFYQVEGIVVDENANFRHLLGILKHFYDEMGFKKVRFRPAYFPYTEMSVEPEVYMEERKSWIELGGAGIFRPEVVKPLLGFSCPVLAWGLGVERLVALRMGLGDIRDLYIPDLKWLQNAVLL